MWESRRKDSGKAVEKQKNTQIMGGGIANLKVVGTERNRISYSKLQESQRKGKELEVRCYGNSSPPIEYD